MKKQVLAFALSALVSPALFAGTVAVGDSGVTFEAPEGFEPLSAEMMAVKWPTNRAPAYAVGTATGATTVAYDVKPNPLPQAALPEAQKSFTQVFDRIIPGIVWKKNEIVSHAGQQWLFMEMSSHAVDADIHNIMLVTGVDGRMVVFNFNSTRKEFPQYEAALRKSIDSIRLPAR